MRTIKFLLAAGFLLMSGTSIYAQVQRNEAYLPKFAVKTNALYWATSTPNLGFEVGLAKKLTLDISGNYNPWKFGDDRQIKHWLVQPELRYWLCERFNGSFFGLHGHYGEMNVQPEYLRNGARPLRRECIRSGYLLWLSMDNKQTLEHGGHHRRRICPPEI